MYYVLIQLEDISLGAKYNSYLVYSGKVKGSLKIFSLLETDFLGEKKSPRESLSS